MNSNKNINIKPKKKNKFLNTVIFLVISGIIGAIIGFVLAPYLKGFMDTYSKNDNLFMKFLKVYGLFLIFFVGYIVHIILHEAGHLIFGLMTGYSFISFRIFSFTIVKEDGKIKYKKFNIPGTAGQCLMMPPDLEDGKYPFVIYNFGGVIMNLIVSIIGILIVVLVKELIFPFNTILILFSLAGLLIVLTNGIPMKLGGVPNDAYNVLSMIRDEEAKRGFYIQLRVNGLQSLGTRIKDMPIETFKLKEGSDLCNPLNTAIVLMEYNWHLDNMDLDSAKQCIDSFIPYLDKVVPLFKNEINCERMFLELVGDCDKKFIDDLYDKNLKKYIRAAKFMLGKKRLLMAYEGFYNEDKNQALKHYEDIRKLAEEYPIKGDADMELMISNWIKERL
ncbi:M50 family metallopeptidase [Tissierella sp. MSJ-40]|uniref:M50 family metallopeptidase n=1 Tax=Tissierella simiarum TaxID=2841534 RepID=A0ABS6E7A0_9FIRM|nr:M50 family metallopeptidase [Tissierella simiarum]MBU5438426.1 M50 family metallopeptidase [Tissierella simiarum]